jgi:hypothetical protein
MIKKWIINKFFRNNPTEFEGRCHICKKRLHIKVYPRDSLKVELELVPCLWHLEESTILMPIVRDDLIFPTRNWYKNPKLLDSLEIVNDDTDT